MSAAPLDDRPARALRVISDQVDQATRAAKCHGCGCLHQTVAALEATEVGNTLLSGELSAARATFIPKKYDCLGCPVCYPAIAANAFTEAFPSAGEVMDLCPTEAPNERTGWPPLPGSYTVLRFNAPVAVCTLNSEVLMHDLIADAPDALSMVGTLDTENLGIERVIKNVLGNPNIRFLVLAGRTRDRPSGIYRASPSRACSRMGSMSVDAYAARGASGRCSRTSQPSRSRHSFGK